MTTRSPRCPTAPDAPRCICESGCDIFPNYGSVAFQKVQEAYLYGRRVSTKGMSDEEFINALLGSQDIRPEE
jgi:hypothetical protein